MTNKKYGQLTACQTNNLKCSGSGSLHVQCPVRGQRQSAKAVSSIGKQPFMLVLACIFHVGSGVMATAPGVCLTCLRKLLSTHTALYVKGIKARLRAAIQAVHACMHAHLLYSSVPQTGSCTMLGRRHSGWMDPRCYTLHKPNQDSMKWHHMLG